MKLVTLANWNVSSEVFPDGSAALTFLSPELLNGKPVEIVTVPITPNVRLAIARNFSAIIVPPAGGGLNDV